MAIGEGEAVKVELTEVVVVELEEKGVVLGKLWQPEMGVKTFFSSFLWCFDMSFFLSSVDLS